ncbi:hypothetical protein [Cypionkella sp. TWP1-2-1b2]|uniref:hypothetical protein n=1 Tax=Cypionkella sp. TWP1-2-1b2 TaxID=2804675 RepID=UPI003CE777EE
MFEVNIDFFAQRLLPQRAAMGARMHKLLQHWVGQQVSQDLSDGATALPVSQI